MMPRFSDEWVIDRVLFDYVSGGSCACCGFQYLLPNGSTADLIGAVTDLETDQAAAEVAALQQHPWPVELRDQIWADRVKLRQKLKRKMPTYANFWKEHGDAFQEWCTSTNGATVVSGLLQLPRSEILEVARQQYGVHSAYGVVLCAVLEQVAHFGVTAYPTDARGDDNEINFEKALQFGRMGGFTMNLIDPSSESINEDMLQVWLKRMRSLGGPKLLGRGQSKTGDDDGGDADGPGSSTTVIVGPSFQSDRRIVRLLIAHYWSDTVIKLFLEREAKIEDVREGEGRE